MAKASGDKAKPAKDKEKERLSKEAAIKDSREKRSEARAAASSLKDNDGLGAAAVAGAAAAASIREGSKSKDLPPVASPPRTRRGEKSVEPNSPAAAHSGRKGRRTQQIQSSEEEEQGSDKSVPASESEDEAMTTAARVSAGNKLRQKAKIQVDSNAALLSLLDFTI
jgi:hypothetical protein